MKISPACFNPRLLVCFIFLVNHYSIIVSAQPAKYTVANAHAHNDYLHPIPFYTAYNAGFGSIEADVFSKNNQLYVAHDSVAITSQRTLQSLYLNPLQKEIKKNKGHVYSNHLKKLILLIDLKTPAESTLQALLRALQRFKIITGCPSLKIVFTGNQPDVSRLTSFPSYLYFDGNLKKNYSVEELAKIGLFSDNFRNYSSWSGEGILPESDQKIIDSLVTKSHSLNLPIRFWAAPDLQNAWYQLMQLKVDYINTDKIEEISTFFNHLLLK